MQLPPRPAFGDESFVFDDAVDTPAEAPAPDPLEEASAAALPDHPLVRSAARQMVRRPRRARPGQDRRGLLLALSVAALFLLSLLASSTSISPVYARAVAPAAAQDGGLPPPPRDATGQLLPPDGTTVPPGFFAAEAHNPLAVGKNPSPLDSSCVGGGSHTPDGDPYPVCPGPQPARGGNCTWWAWEMWHDLGFNLPGWGDATYWATHAESFGLQVGTVPRVNALAIFPRGDGVWAFSSAGHVAFVTQVYSDLDTFDVTYENYGDPTLVHYGHHYRVSIIQKPQFQNGELRFIYFPGTGGTPTSGFNSTLGISNYAADFAGDGHTQVLRYDRTQGTFDFLELSDDLSTLNVTPLENPTTSDGTWGSFWEVYVGDFNGDGRADLLLYDRQHGKARFITLTSYLSIDTDVTQSNWKPSWEIYVGKFDGVHDQLLFYDRQTDQDHGQWTPEPGEPAVPVGVTSQGAGGDSSPGGNGNQPGGTYDPNSSDWQHHHRTATLAVIDYNNDFTVRRQVDFDRWHNTWEVTIGHFGQAGRDGILFYDRKQGELLMAVFDKHLRMSATYQQHKVFGGWEVYAGDYDGTLQDSLFLFDRSSGKAEMLAFNPNLTLRRQVNFTNWGQSWEFYTGHFGGKSSAAEGLLMYSRGAGILSFVGFGPDLTVAQQASYRGFRSTWTVYVGQYGPSCTNSLGGAGSATATPAKPTTPTATPTQNPNNEGAPTSTGGSTVSVTQNCPDSVLLVDERTGQARLITFSFDNGLQGGKPDFTQTTVPWITPTPTNTPNPTNTPTGTPGP